MAMFLPCGETEDMSVFPTHAELVNNTSAGISSNIVKGSYRNANHYLNVHIQLLREDFLDPLRKGIQSFRNTRSFGCDGIDLYPQTTLEHVSVSKSQKLGFYINISKAYHSKIHAKSFMVGSLLLFTADNFLTFLYATVLERDDERLKGKVLIQIWANPDMLNGEWFKKKPFLMAESKTFFQPYYWVIKSLKTLREDNFPMIDYIVYSKCQRRRPQHLPQFLNVFGHRIDPNKTRSWPSADQMEMNPSQYEALKTALTSTLSLIQGPPGTGKTYVGLKIVQVLLANLPQPKKPILIICQTNHALDQFLESMLKFTTKIVRVGGNSKSEVLKKFNLRGEYYNNLKQACKTNSLPDRKKMREISQAVCIRISTALSLNSKSKAYSKLYECISKEEYEEYISRSINSELSGQTSDANIMKNVDVIGMTTTCAARMHPVLEIVQPAVVIIEEAAEVLEAHVVSSLTKSCEQLILIGDHKQLKPYVATAGLAKDHGLDVSLFERLINNEVYCPMLNIQHRMHPDISRLISFIYPKLKDHESVCKYKIIGGICKNVFFLNHRNYEKKVAADGSPSKSNPFEVEFLVELAQYLLNQGYGPSQITILTPYAAQVQLFLKMIRKYKKLTNVKCISVDGYQGEESDIILLSLVRSRWDNEASIGFLNSENRLCVALSRARKGLFIVGNMDNLSGNSSVWCKIKLILQRQGNIDDEMTLYCTKHKSAIPVKHPKDFVKFEYGNCDKPCDEMKKCGHLCKFKCHRDNVHDSAPCREPNFSTCIHDLPGRRLCYESICCEVMIEKRLRCGHRISLPCYREEEMSTSCPPCSLLFRYKQTMHERSCISKIRRVISRSFNALVHCVSKVWGVFKGMLF